MIFWGSLVLICQRDVNYNYKSLIKKKNHKYVQRCLSFGFYAKLAFINGKKQEVPLIFHPMSEINLMFALGVENVKIRSK